MIKNLIIACLAIALVICSYKLYESKPGSGFSPPSPNQGVFYKPMPTDQAKQYIDSFRLNYSLDASKGVYYELDTIKNYIDNIYTDLTGERGRIALKKGYRWAVGFYFMRRPKSPNEYRLDFLVVPTMILADNNDSILDFRDHMSDYIVKPSTAVVPKDCGTCAGYDAGHLWP